MNACEICGKALGSRGHRCQTGMCYGTYLRAQRILESRTDGNASSIDGDNNAQFRRQVDWTIETKDRRPH